jgi:hypothetical protein
MNTKLECKYDLHEKLCKTLNPMYRMKNTDYDDSFGKSITEDGYIAAMTLIKDKLNRAANLLKDAEKASLVKDESVEDTLLDLANYALMLLTEYKIRETKI